MTPILAARTASAALSDSIRARSSSTNSALKPRRTLSAARKENEPAHVFFVLQRTSLVAAS